MNADRVAIQKFVEAFERRRSRWPQSLRVGRWLIIIFGIIFAGGYIFDKPIDPLVTFFFLLVAVIHGAEELFANVLVPLAREHLRSASSDRDAA